MINIQKFKMREVLIYKRPNVTLKYIPNRVFKTTLYNMIDTKSGKFIGNMYTQAIRNCQIPEIYPDKKACDLLFIHELIIENRFQHKGYGTKFLNIAKKESKEKNCKGRIALIASSNEDSPSHIFYRKNGFQTISAWKNKILDLCIADKEAVKNYYFEPQYMYLSVNEESKYKKISQKIKFRLIKFLNKFV